MDFMKVLDQTVREIKREVNLKVLKVPEIEQKVLDATSDEPWGPHGSALAEIARETKKITECQMIMNVLWTRLTDTGPNWRHVYKALSVIEYLVANGSDRAVDDIIEHTFQISSLSGFEYVEPNGKDMGINVRKKVETILGLLNDREKIKAVRDKAAATRDKYFGLSSSGVTYKSSAAAFGSSNFRQNDRFGGISSSREGESFKDSYKGRDQYGEETGTENAKSKNEVEHRGRVKDSFSSSNSKTSDKQGSTHSSKSTNAQMSNNEDDFDDFDPRGSSTSGSAAASSKQVDLFGGSLLIDLMDEPVSVPTETATSETAATAEVDLFADAAFVSAPPHAGATAGSRIQENMDLFANQPAAPTSFSSKVDLFEIPDPVLATVTEPPPPEPTNSSSFDPFAAVPLNNFDDSDFGTFTSHTGSTNLESSQGSPYDSFNNLNSTSTASKPPPKKGTFQVKSGIWADSLSRGLIDLNITAPSAAKKTSLADIGIVGGLGDATEDKGTHASVYMGRAMGLGTGLGRTGFSSSSEAAGKDDFFGAFK